MIARHDCPRCDGTGHVPDEDRGSPICPDCDGNGVDPLERKVMIDWEARLMTLRAAKRLIEELEQIATGSRFFAYDSNRVARFDAMYLQLVNLVNSLKVKP